MPVFAFVFGRYDFGQHISYTILDIAVTLSFWLRLLLMPTTGDYYGSLFSKILEFFSSKASKYVRAVPYNRVMDIIFVVLHLSNDMIIITGSLRFVRHDPTAQLYFYTSLLLFF